MWYSQHIFKINFFLFWRNQFCLQTPLLKELPISTIQKEGKMFCFLDAIASPSTYPCQWVGESVSDSFRFGDSYRISELCELVWVTTLFDIFSVLLSFNAFCQTPTYSNQSPMLRLNWKLGFDNVKISWTTKMTTKTRRTNNWEHWPAFTILARLSYSSFKTVNLMEEIEFWG